MSESQPAHGNETAARDASAGSAIIRPLGWLAAVVVFTLMTLTAVDVAGRYLMSAPIPGASFLAAALMGAMIFIALPLVTERDEQLRAGLLDHWFKGRANHVKELVVRLVSLTALGALAYVLWRQGVIYARTNAQLPSIGLSLGTVAFLGAAMSALSALIVLFTTFRRFAPRLRRRG
jgi:TRAP-type C4-dicarboxylate transport system permease small subunit